MVPEGTAMRGQNTHSGRATTGGGKNLEGQCWCWEAVLQLAFELGLEGSAGLDRTFLGVGGGWNSMSRSLAHTELRAMSGEGDSLL